MRVSKLLVTIICAAGVGGSALMGVAPALAAGDDPATAAERSERHAAAAAEMRAELEADFNTLGLSATQKQDLGTLVQLYGEQLGALINRGETARIELLQLSPLDPDYDTLTNEVSQQAAATAGDVVNTLSEFQRTAFLLLSNEQQDRFLELRAERQQKARAALAEMRARREAAKAASGNPLGN